MLLGYARVSTLKQDAGYDAQLRDLRNAGVEERNIYKEKISSRSPTRPELDALLRNLREGDQLVVTKLDRLARSVKQVMEIHDVLESRGASLNVLSMGLDTNTATGRLLLSILASVAEFEVNIQRERMMEGIEKAKSEGKFRGRKPTVRKKKDAILVMAKQGVHKKEIAEQLGVGVASVYRILAEERARQPINASAL